MNVITEGQPHSAMFHVYTVVFPGPVQYKGWCGQVTGPAQAQQKHFSVQPMNIITEGQPHSAVVSCCHGNYCMGLHH